LFCKGEKSLVDGLQSQVLEGDLQDFNLDFLEFLELADNVKTTATPGSLDRVR